MGEAIAPVIARVAAKLANTIAEWISRIGREDAVGGKSVTGIGVDDVVSHDPHVFESQEQALRTVPHTWRCVGGVVVVDCVGGMGCMMGDGLSWWFGDGCGGNWMILLVKRLQYVGIRQRKSLVCCDVLLGQLYVCCVNVHALLNASSAVNSEYATGFGHCEVVAGDQAIRVVMRWLQVSLGSTVSMRENTLRSGQSVIDTAVTNCVPKSHVKCTSRLSLRLFTSSSIPFITPPNHSFSHDCRTGSLILGPRRLTALVKCCTSK